MLLTLWLSAAAIAADAPLATCQSFVCLTCALHEVVPADHDAEFREIFHAGEATGDRYPLEPGVWLEFVEDNGMRRFTALEVHRQPGEEATRTFEGRAEARTLLLDYTPLLDLKRYKSWKPGRGEAFERVDRSNKAFEQEVLSRWVAGEPGHWTLESFRFSWGVEGNPWTHCEELQTVKRDRLDPPQNTRTLQETIALIEENKAQRAREEAAIAAAAPRIEWQREVPYADEPSEIDLAYDARQRKDAGKALADAIWTVDREIRAAGTSAKGGADSMESAARQMDAAAWQAEEGNAAVGRRAYFSSNFFSAQARDQVLGARSNIERAQRALADGRAAAAEAGCSIPALGRLEAAMAPLDPMRAEMSRQYAQDRFDSVVLQELSARLDEDALMRALEESYAVGLRLESDGSCP